MRVYVELNLIPFELWFKTPMIGVVLEWASVDFWQDSLWTTLVLLIFKHTFLWIKFSLRYLYKCWIWFSVGFFFWKYKIHPDPLYACTICVLMFSILTQYTCLPISPVGPLGLLVKPIKCVSSEKFVFVCTIHHDTFVCLPSLKLPDFCISLVSIIFCFMLHCHSFNSK